MLRSGRLVSAPSLSGTMGVPLEMGICAAATMHPEHLRRRCGHALELFVELLDHPREVARRERIFGPRAGSFWQHQASRSECGSQHGVPSDAGTKNVNEPCFSAGTILGKDLRWWRQHAVVGPAVGIVEGAGVCNLEATFSIGPQAGVTVPLQDFLQ